MAGLYLNCVGVASSGTPGLNSKIRGTGHWFLHQVLSCAQIIFYLRLYPLGGSMIYAKSSGICRKWLGKWLEYVEHSTCGIAMSYFVTQMSIMLMPLNCRELLFTVWEFSWVSTHANQGYERIKQRHSREIHPRQKHWWPTAEDHLVEKSLPQVIYGNKTGTYPPNGVFRSIVYHQKRMSPNVWKMNIFGIYWPWRCWLLWTREGLSCRERNQSTQRVCVCSVPDFYLFISSFLSWNNFFWITESRATVDTKFETRSLDCIN